MRKRSAVVGALAAAFATAFATAALAAGPYRIADVDQNAVAIQDLGSKVSVSDDVVQVWEVRLFDQAQSGPATFDEKRTLREFDCAKHAMRTKDVVYYRSGHTVSRAADAGWSAWKTIAAQGLGELSLLTACCPHPEVTQTYGSINELKQMAWGRQDGPAS